MDQLRISWVKLNELVELYRKADLLSAKVGMVLVPVIFSGACVASWFLLPASLNSWMIPGIVLTGLLILLFIFRYNRRAQSRPGYVLVANGLEFLTLSPNSLERAYFVNVHVSSAYAITPNGPGTELTELRNTTVRKIVMGYYLYEALKTHQPQYIVCVSGGPCFGFLANDGIYAIQDGTQKVKLLN